MLKDQEGRLLRAFKSCTDATTAATTADDATRCEVREPEISNFRVKFSRSTGLTSRGEGCNTVPEVTPT